MVGEKLAPSGEYFQNTQAVANGLDFNEFRKTLKYIAYQFFILVKIID